jgi:hypothetical protein
MFMPSPAVRWRWSSFGAEAGSAQIDRTVPVLFIDTEMLFEYQRDVASSLG